MLTYLINLKHSAPRLWAAGESINGLLFRLRMSHIHNHAASVLSNAHHLGYSFSLVTDGDITAISQMLNDAPLQYILNFAPHGFDEATLRRLLANPSFVLMKVTEDATGLIVGYFFLRCFFIGRAFHGLFVKPGHNNQGIGTQMWRLSSLICERAHLSMHATIADSNLPSIKSLQHGCQISHIRPVSTEYHIYDIQIHN